MKKYSLAELKKLPTIHSAHFDNLKVETPTRRVWLSRMTKADGASCDNEVTVEHLEKGYWVPVAKYEAK